MIDADKLLKELDFERLAGTAGEERARSVLTGHLDAIGLPYVVEQFEIYGFETGKATIEVEGQALQAHPFGLESSQILEGPLAFLENADVLAYNSGAFRDKVVLSCTYSRRTIELLGEQRARAFILICGAHRGATSLSHRQKQYEDGQLMPSVTMSYEDAQRLIAHDGKWARITIEQTAGRMTAHNIVVTAGSPDRDNTLTYLVGHYDTVSRSHGGVDNAAGTVCLVKAAEYFAQNCPERELKIIFFSGEELGLRGSFSYVETHAEEVKDRARLVVNVDLSGEIIGRDSLAVLGTKQLMGYAGGLAREAGLMFSERLDIFSSDCMPFCAHEVPSVNISRGDGQGIFFTHTADDRAENISGKGLENSYTAARFLLERILQAGIYPIKKEIDESLREKIEKYLYNALLVKPELKWRKKYQT